MKVFVTGAIGQLGHDVMKELVRRNHEAIGTDTPQMDITDTATVEKYITEFNPDAVIHCAAWTAVDSAEEAENIPKVYAVNTDATKSIAKICSQINSKLIYLSTDYVFSGGGETPWKIDDERKPLNIYGQTKYEGELAVEKYTNRFFTVRISWVFGINGKNFVKQMLCLGKDKEKLEVVNDQIGNPTYTRDLTQLLVDMIETEKYGYYHATNEGEYISWYDFAVEIFKQASVYNSLYKRVEVVPIGSSFYPTKAKRPSNSRLSKQRLADMGFKLLPTWQDALKRYLMEAEIQEIIRSRNHGEL